MNKQLFAIALLGTAAMAARRPNGRRNDREEDFEFLQFVSANGKDYRGASELAAREANWKKAKQNIDELNSLGSSTRGGATFAVNELADLDEDELHQHLGLKQSRPPLNATHVTDFTRGRHLQSDLTKQDIDWRDNMVPVKNQGGCGSCSCFSAASAIEGMQSIKYGTEPVRLSEQQGLDCTETSCNYGGWMYWFFDYAKTNGVNSEADYPYTARDGNCQNNPDTAVSFVSDYATVAAGWDSSQNPTVENIRAALENGPLTMALAAGHNMFYYYEGGVITADMGCPESVDHAIVIVGYEVVGGGDGETEYEEDWSKCYETVETFEYVEYCRKSTRNERRNKECDPETNPDWDEYFKTSKPMRNKCCIEMETVATSEERFIDGCEPDIIEKETSDGTGMGVWLVQNSWGTGWGDQGFARIEAKDGIGVCAMNYWTQSVNVA